MRISKLKVGDELIAIDECTMDNGTGNALTIGRIYPIISIDENGLCVIDDFGDMHSYDICDLHGFFKTKAPKEPIDVLIEWISEMLSKFPDDLNLSQRGLYDGYLNSLNKAKEIKQQHGK